MLNKAFILSLAIFLSLASDSEVIAGDKLSSNSTLIVSENDSATDSPLTWIKLKTGRTLQSLEEEAESWTKPPPLVTVESFLQHPDWIRNLTIEAVSENRPFGIVDVFTECLEGWEAPQVLKENFPYYLAGNDEIGRPVWVAEAGKFNLRKIVEEGGSNLEALDKYMRQGAYRVVKSVVTQITKENRNVEFRFILDFDGLNVRQLLHLPTVTYAIKYSTIYNKILTNHAGPSVVINANYPTETLLNIWKPIWPSLLEKMDVYGTNRAKWLPRLRHHFPIEILPEWYGGSKDFAPLQVYG